MSSTALTVIDFTAFEVTRARPSKEDLAAVEAARKVIELTVPATALEEVHELETEYTQLLEITGTVMKVTDDDSYRIAGENVVAAKEFLARGKKWFDYLTKPFNAVHKLATTKRSEILDPIDKYQVAQWREMQTYSERKRREAEEARRKAEAEQRRLEEEARKAAEEAEKEAAPWDEPVQVVVPKVEMPVVRAEPPKVDGLGERNLPWHGEITDLKAFVRWCVEEGREAEFLLVNQPALNLRAKTMNTTMEAMTPGARAIRGTTSARR
jgi:Skp family chaperone for outer membrane proteins